jgi:hypothetical protein
LAQTVSVNGTAYQEHPINAIIVPRGNSAIMTPVEKIDVFLAANVNSSTVLSRISSKLTTLTYKEGIIEFTLDYDSMIGKFCPAT